MDFRKKLKMRFYFALSYIIIGLALIIVSIVTEDANEFLSSFGAALLVIGIARVRNHFIITKNEQSIKKQEIIESDERNIAISNRAKNFSFNLYVILAGITVIVLQILKISELATIIGLTVCVLILIYWVSYFIIRKKS